MARGNWKTKPVNFNDSNPEDRDLYDFAGELPNFTQAVKEYLKVRRDGGVLVFSPAKREQRPQQREVM